MIDTTNVLLDWLAADASPEARLEYRQIVDALQTCERHKCGLSMRVLSANDVRAKLAEMHPPVRPARVGSTFRRLAHAGVLIAVSSTRSTDTRSRNAGRLIPAYTFHPEALA